MGAIYLSTSSTSPQTLFGGTWQRIQDRFLLCAGATYAAGSTGGEASHTLTVNEMPAHSHGLVGDSQDWGLGGKPYFGTSQYDETVETTSVGGGQAHNNMPPYLSVYAWRRTA